MDHLEAGVDLEGLADLAEGYKKNTKGFKELSSSSLAPLGGTQYKSVMPGTLIGSYKTLARKVAEHVEAADLDGSFAYCSGLYKSSAPTRLAHVPATFGVWDRVQCRR